MNLESEMTSNQPDVTLEQLRAMSAAFAAHDVEGIVEWFHDDGEFRNAKGPDVWGQAYKGKAELRRFFTTLFSTTPDVRWKHTAEFVAGNRGVTEWHRTGTHLGEKQEWLGCDIYTFREGKIARKETYVKIIVPR